MGRSLDALKLLSAELKTNVVLSGKTPAEIASILNAPMSQTPKVFVDVPVSQTVDSLVQVLETKAVLNSGDTVKTVQEEVLVKRADELSLGEITQGDVEQALLL